MADYAAKLRARLSDNLRSARKARDRPSIDTLRSLMAALDNAGAVSVEVRPPAYAPGGSTEIPRRELTWTDVTELLRREADERNAAADEYERYGQPLEAACLRAGAAAIEPLITAWRAEDPDAPQ